MKRNADDLKNNWEPIPSQSESSHYEKYVTEIYIIESQLRALKNKSNIMELSETDVRTYLRLKTRRQSIKSEINKSLQIKTEQLKGMMK